MNDEFAILDTHYGVARYLYFDIFKQKHHEIDDLQNQNLFLKNINKYFMCRNGQYAHLYNMYTNLNKEQIKRYFEGNIMKINITSNTWLNFTNIINIPRTLPNTIDGPYMIDNLTLRRYTYFWHKNFMKSNILATPFYCLDGLDHLYYEIIHWKTACETVKRNFTIKTRHIFHEIFYVIEFDDSTTNNGNKIKGPKFLLWLDQPNIETELYIPHHEEHICLLKQLYIASDDEMLTDKINNLQQTSMIQNLSLLNMLINNLSQNFITTFTGKMPKQTKNAPLNLTSKESLKFYEITNYGFDTNKNDQIYQIQNLSELIIMPHIQTTNFLIIQEDFNVASKPTISDMNDRFYEFIFYLSKGIIDVKTFIRMYMRPLEETLDTFANSMRKQLAVVYVQKYHKFIFNNNITTTASNSGGSSNSRSIADYDSLFFEKSYVFSSRNLLCTVKSIKYLLRYILTPSPLLPSCVLLSYASSIDANYVPWKRLTQNIIFFKRTHAICFLNNFTIQNILPSSSSAAEKIYTNNNNDDEDFKRITIIKTNQIKEELKYFFNLNKYENKILLIYKNIELHCITINKKLNLQIYYFVKNDNDDNDDDTLKNFFIPFMYSNENKKILNKKILVIFYHLFNLYHNNIIL